MTNGIKTTIAIPLIPELTNEYKLSKNRRKSNKTLPPFSWVYSDSLFEYTLAITIILHDYFQLQSAPSETSGIQSY